MAANRYGQIWHGKHHHVNIRFPSAEARLKFQDEFEAYHASHEHDGDIPTFRCVTTKDLKLGTGDKSPQDLVKAETDKDYRITIDGYSWNEVHDYHNPSGFSNYFWYRVPTCCVPPTIVIDREFVDSGTLQRHRLSAFFQDMTDTEFQSLVESVKADGFIDPIIRIYEGQILDGWHRYRAAQELNLIRKLKFQQWDEDDRKDGDPTAFVLARNLERRHLTPAQRGQIVFTFNERFGHGGDRSKPSNEGLKTQAELAEQAGVSVSTIERASKVEKAGQSEAVIAGEKSPSQIIEEERAGERQLEKETVLEQLYQNRQDFQTAVSDFAQSGASLDFTYCRRRITSLIGLEDSTDEGSTDYTQWDLQKLKTQSRIASQSVLVIQGYMDEDPEIEGHPIAPLLSEMQRISEIHQSAKTLDTYTRPFLIGPLSHAVEKVEKLWTADWEAKSDEDRLDDLDELDAELPSLIEAEDTARASGDTLDALWEQVKPAISAWKKEREGVGYASKTMFVHAARRYMGLPSDAETTPAVLKELLQLLTSEQDILETLVNKQLQGRSLWEEWEDDDDAEDDDSDVSDPVDVEAIQRDIVKARAKAEAEDGMVSFQPIANKYGIAPAEVSRIASGISGSAFGTEHAETEDTQEPTEETSESVQLMDIVATYSDEDGNLYQREFTDTFAMEGKTLSDLPEGVQAAFQALAPEAEAVEEPAAAPPEPPKTVASLLDENAGDLRLEICWMYETPDKDGPQFGGATFEDDASSNSRPISEIPEDLLVQLLQIVRKGKSS